MLVFHIIIRAASGIFNHRITNNFDIPRPDFPREFRPKDERARFTEFRPPQWAHPLAEKGSARAAGGTLFENLF